MRDLNVLVVDDAFFMRNLLKKILSQKPKSDFKFNIMAEAINGEDALELYKIGRPDIITVDINMPRLNGINFLKEVRKINPDVFAIIISTTMNNEVKAEINKDNTYYLTKSFQPEFLYKILDEIGVEFKNISLKKAKNKKEQAQIKEIEVKPKIKQEVNQKENILSKEEPKKEKPKKEILKKTEPKKEPKKKKQKTSSNSKEVKDNKKSKPNSNNSLLDDFDLTSIYAIPLTNKTGEGLKENKPPSNEKQNSNQKKIKNKDNSINVKSESNSNPDKIEGQKKLKHQEKNINIHLDQDVTQVNLNEKKLEFNHSEEIINESKKVLVVEKIPPTNNTIIEEELIIEEEFGIEEELILEDRLEVEEELILEEELELKEDLVDNSVEENLVLEENLEVTLPLLSVPDNESLILTKEENGKEEEEYSIKSEISNKIFKLQETVLFKCYELMELRKTELSDSTKDLLKTTVDKKNAKKNVAQEEPKITKKVEEESELDKLLLALKNNPGEFNELLNISNKQSVGDSEDLLEETVDLDDELQKLMGTQVELSVNQKNIDKKNIDKTYNLELKETMPHYNESKTKKNVVISPPKKKLSEQYNSKKITHKVEEKVVVDNKKQSFWSKFNIFKKK